MRWCFVAKIAHPVHHFLFKFGNISDFRSNCGNSGAEINKGYKSEALKKDYYFFFCRGLMISGEDCEFIQRFEQKRAPEEKQELIQTEGNQVIQFLWSK